MYGRGPLPTGRAVRTDRVLRSALWASVALKVLGVVVSPPPRRRADSLDRAGGRMAMLAADERGEGCNCGETAF